MHVEFLTAGKFCFGYKFLKENISSTSDKSGKTLVRELNLFFNELFSPEKVIRIVKELNEKNRCDESLVVKQTKENRVN